MNTAQRIRYARENLDALKGHMRHTDLAAKHCDEIEAIYVIARELRLRCRTAAGKSSETPVETAAREPKDRT